MPSSVQYVAFVISLLEKLLIRRRSRMSRNFIPERSRVSAAAGWGGEGEERTWDTFSEGAPSTPLLLLRHAWKTENIRTVGAQPYSRRLAIAPFHYRTRTGSRVIWICNFMTTPGENSRTYTGELCVSSPENLSELIRQESYERRCRGREERARSTPVCCVCILCIQFHAAWKISKFLSRRVVASHSLAAEYELDVRQFCKWQTSAVQMSRGGNGCSNSRMRSIRGKLSAKTPGVQSPPGKSLNPRIMRESIRAKTTKAGLFSGTSSGFELVFKIVISNDAWFRTESHGRSVDSCKCITYGELHRDGGGNKGKRVILLRWAWPSISHEPVRDELRAVY